MKPIYQKIRRIQDMLFPGKFNQLRKLLKRSSLGQEEVDLQATITHHPNGLIVFQLNQPLQSIFLNTEEATAIAKALLLEARRVRIAIRR
jgi:hypothetical protein